jgi:hypothetical protein
LGLFFFAEQTVTAITYLGMLQFFLLLQLEDYQPNVMFHQDVAPSHWACIDWEFIGIHFPGRWVGRNVLFPWPPSSPGVTPLDFFLWGNVKDIVYNHCDLYEQKLRIVAAIETVLPQMLWNT